MTNVLEYLDDVKDKFPDKIAFSGAGEDITFLQMHNISQSIGTYLLQKCFYKEPIVVFMDKRPSTLATFFGVLRAGCYYVALDKEMPQFRIDLILKKLNPRAIIFDGTTIEKVKDLSGEYELLNYENIVKCEKDELMLNEVFEKSIDIDPIYVVFTSGSTGMPKGVTACHRSVIDYVENLSNVLKADENSVFGNQSPFYFDACLKEVFCTLKYGGTTYIIPKELFMFPVKLVEFLNEKKINTICWVASALTFISSLKTFEKVVPKYLKTVAFGSELFPIKQFKLWKEALLDARFINLYGPTEATGMSCYYEINREFQLDEVIPIGKPFKNTEILLIDDENKEIREPNIKGEICIRGTAVTLGYYKAPDETMKAFRQNPLNDVYHETVYFTGDLGMYNEHGELVFASRKDYQIKHMGHRIELSEIEMVINNSLGVQTSCALYDKEKGKIILFYVGEVSEGEIIKELKEKLPRYMIPNIIKRIEMMPLTPNGKINRVLLREQINKEEV